MAPRDAPTVTILEWVCGGGLLGTPLKNVSRSLLAEGQAMLRTLVHGLAEGGVRLQVPLDIRLFRHDMLKQIASQAQVIELTNQRPNDWLEAWCKLAGRSEWSWLVAPESDGALKHAACHLRSSGVRLLNGSDDFLRTASDKLCCSELWQTAGISHPPTRSLEAIDETWLSRSAQSPTVSRFDLADASAQWVVKPADGAGGEGLQIVNCRQLLELRKLAMGAGTATRERRPIPRLIVQPWLDGIAASCSAIVDTRGSPHWLPLVSQDFAQRDNPAPTYLGCTYPAPGIFSPVPMELLRKALSTLPGTPLGWIGFDLKYSPMTDEWWVIEINPRCTSSLVGLATAYAGNLVYDSFRLQTNALSQLADRFAPVVFRIPHHNDY